MPAPQMLSDDWVLDAWTAWLICPDCFTQGRALRADCSKQNHGQGGPRRAFWDHQCTCGTCSAVFVFKAEEQRFWYETLGFSVHSHPVQCPACRHERRRRKRGQALLQQLLPLPGDASWRQIEEVAKAAAACGASNALEYLRQAKNRCNEPEDKARLQAEIDVFKPLEPQKLGSSRNLSLERCREKERDLGVLSDEERAYALKAPGLPRDQCSMVARIDGMWLRPEPDLQDRRQLAYLHGETICPNIPPHEPKVLIDSRTGVFIFLPRSRSRGQTGHYRRGDDVFGPPGALPWV